MDMSTVDSVAQLIEVVAEAFGETRSRWWFRGQIDHSWTLLPGVKRGYSLQQERYLTNLFYTRARTRYNNCPQDQDYGGWLALMQHFGLPTRLLDWTASPLVAAYFAVKYSFDQGKGKPSGAAAIWMLEPHRLNEAQGYEPVFPPLNAASLENLIRPAIKGGDTSDIKVLAASPLETDLKMLTQQGFFTVHVSDEPLDKMQGCEEWLRKVVIPVESIPRFEMELDVLGVRLADIFPDLQNLAREISNMHRPEL